MQACHSSLCFSLSSRYSIIEYFNDILSNDACTLCQWCSQGRRETGRAPGLGLSWGPTVEGCKNLFWVTPLAMQLDGL